jgi:hypothetical protein
MTLARFVGGLATLLGVRPDCDAASDVGHMHAVPMSRFSEKIDAVFVLTERRRKPHNVAKENHQNTVEVCCM